MPNRIGVNLSLDDHHCRAICDEIGDRLRYYLAQEVTEIPPYLRRLIDQLAELDQHAAPSIVPSIDEDFAMDQQACLDSEPAGRPFAFESRIQNPSRLRPQPRIA
jgi:hypothetical protein